MANENSFCGYLHDNPLYVSGLGEEGADTYQLPTSSNEREDRERDQDQATQQRLWQGVQRNNHDDGMLVKMQTLEVSGHGDVQSKANLKQRPLLARPQPERVVFSQPGSANAFSFELQKGPGLEGTDWDQESIYAEPNAVPLRDESETPDYVGPSHNPADINAFFQRRAGELVGLVDPQTLDAIPEQELFALISAGMMSLRRRRSVFW